MLSCEYCKIFKSNFFLEYPSWLLAYNVKAALAVIRFRKQIVFSRTFHGVSCCLLLYPSQKRLETLFSFFEFKLVLIIMLDFSFFSRSNITHWVPQNVAYSSGTGEFKTPKTSKMELFVRIVKDWKPFTMVAKSSILVATRLDLDRCDIWLHIIDKVWIDVLRVCKTS